MLADLDYLADGMLESISSYGDDESRALLVAQSMRRLRTVESSASENLNVDGILGAGSE